MAREKQFTQDIRNAPEDEIVCYCAGVSKRSILNALAKGVRSLDQIKATTGACTQGRCRQTSPRGR